MDIRLRNVEEQDAQTLFDWRIDPVTRQYARDTGEFGFESHLEWLEASLRNPLRTMYMALDESGNRVGQVRFDRDGEKAEVDIAVAPAWRGRGVGSEMLRHGCQKYVDEQEVKYLFAEIKKDNTASIRIFEKAGFEWVGEDKDMVRMIRKK